MYLCVELVKEGIVEDEGRVAHFLYHLVQLKPHREQYRSSWELAHVFFLILNAKTHVL